MKNFNLLPMFFGNKNFMLQESSIFADFKFFFIIFTPKKKIIWFRKTLKKLCRLKKIDF